MAGAIVYLALEQLAKIAGQITAQKIVEEVRLVGNVENEVRNLGSNLEAIQAVLLDAEERQMKGDRAVRRWLDKLKDTSYDIEDVLDEWNTEITKLQVEGDLEDAPAPMLKVLSFCLCSCFGIEQVVLRRDIAQNIKELNEKLESIAEEKNRYSLEEKSTETSERLQTTSFVDEAKIFGRESEKDSLVSKLLDDGNEEQKTLPVILLVGMGGIGKTTLAQLAYNNDEVKNHFCTRVWVCVSDPFDEFKVARAIIEGLKCPTKDFVEFQSLLNCIHESIKDKKFLLVLDDVWSEDYNKWESFYQCLKNGSYGSKVLITTRNERVASIMGSIAPIIMEQLAQEECWLLFSQIAFFDRSLECEKLEKIGREIVAKCKGLPLAAKTIGSLLRFKKTRDEWQRILNSEIWKLEENEIEKGLLSSLILSYNDLPSKIKPCFLYCVIFPKDHILKKDQLIKLWMAQGYLGLDNDEEMEVRGQEYFDYLVSRSFFQEFQKDDNENIISCKMHDLVHDYAQFLTKNEYFTVGIKRGSKDLVIDPSNKKVRHSMLLLDSWATFPVSICSLKNLRSLLVRCEDDKNLLADDILKDLVGELTSLRALDISERFGGANLITVIPKEVKNLIHLKYLNLSELNVEKLPETLCELYALQTLDITGCRNLKELPQGMGKLINLRHFLNHGTHHSLSYIPGGMDKLTRLRTLSQFWENSGSSDNSKACSTLACLKDLKHLRGELYIRRLGNVTNVREVKRMQILSNKENLFDLKLEFDKDGEGERNNDDDELLLEALQPHPNLEKLYIDFYRGSSFYFDWISSLTRLRELWLHQCENCMYLSPLGKLPSLESLFIEETSVKKLVTGIESDGAFSSSTSVIPFPKLKVIKCRRMFNWEEWDYGNTILPCLASLSIRCCPKLRALPDGLLEGAKNLQRLKIFGSDLLEERYRKETGEDWQKISHIPNIKFNYSYVQGGPLPLR